VCTSVHACVCVCVHICPCMCMCVCTSVHACVRVCARLSMHVYVCVHICPCMCTCVCTSVHARVRVCACMSMHVYACVRMMRHEVYVRTYIRTYMCAITSFQVDYYERFSQMLILSIGDQVPVCACHGACGDFLFTCCLMATPHHTTCTEAVD